MSTSKVVRRPSRHKHLNLAYLLCKTHLPLLNTFLDDCQMKYFIYEIYFELIFKKGNANLFLNSMADILLFHYPLRFKLPLETFSEETMKVRMKLARTGKADVRK